MNKKLALSLKIGATIASAALLLSMASMHINPLRYPFIGMMGLAFTGLVIINLAFFAFFLIRIGKVSAAISGFALITALLIVPRLWQWPKTEVTDPQGIKILSYNVRLFDLYNWKGNQNTRDSIFHFLENEKPDVICFQEFYWDQTNVFQTRDSLSQFLQLPFISEYYTSQVMEKYYFGMATLSRYPIVSEAFLKFNSISNQCIISDVVYKSDTIRFLNCHLESYRILQEDYKYISVAEPHLSLKSFKSLYRKMSHAIQLRAQQVAEMRQYAKQSPYPLVIIGDFNDTPLSFTYQELKSKLGLCDAFKKAGSGFGGTYNGKLPAYRIDFILHSEQLKSSNFKIHHIPFSDHFPISCYLSPSN